MDAERRYFSIGEMCDDFGVTARALRFYEDEKLISPERRGTTRLYTDRDRARLTWILRGKRVGFSLSDIRELLTALHRQKQDIDTTIAELEEFVVLLDERLQKES